MKNSILIPLLVLFNLGFLTAQIQHKGRPVGSTTSSSPQLRSSSINTVTMPSFEIPENTNKDGSIGYKSFTFAHPFEVNLNPQNSGTWSSLDEGQKVWQLKIKSKDAASLNVIFDQFRLTEGAKLFIYNSDMSHVIGAFTAKNNKASGQLPTMPIMGDEIIIELQESAESSFNSEINIGQVNHDYTGIFNQLRVGYFGDAAYCQKDVSCYVDEIYKDTRRSTLKLIINGSELMTGTLINNTKNDGKPYVITAAHGFEGTNYSAEKTLFIFNYQVPLCFTDVEGTREQSIAGGTIQAYSPPEENNALDFALVEISVTPPTAYRPYYAGWNRSTSSPNYSFCIHHPVGDVKKISFDDDPLTIKTLATTNLVYYPMGHWNVGEWDEGVTEGGSSGSGLFNPTGQLIGGLSAGASSCSSRRNDYFFRFDLAWNTFAEKDRQLAYWLDGDTSDISEITAYQSTEVIKTKRITHIKDDTDITIVKDEKGHIAGTNTRGINEFVEKFENNEVTEILGFYFIAAEGVAASSVHFTIWTGDENPTNRVHKEALLIKQWRYTNTLPPTGTIGGFYPKDSLDMLENFVMLDESIQVNGNYFIGFEVDNTSQENPFGLLLSHNNSADNAYYNDGDWKSYSLLDDYNKKTTLWIDPVVKTELISKLKESTKKQLKIYPNPLHTNQRLTIETDVNSPSIKIVDLMGRACSFTIESQTNGTTIINLKGLPKGIYIISTDNTSRLLQKL